MAKETRITLAPATWGWKGNPPDVFTARRVWECSRWWAAAYGIATAADWLASYFTSRWNSVLLSVAASLITGAIGLVAATRVIRMINLDSPRFRIVWKR